MEILVGVRGDERSDEALAVAEALARGLHASLVLAHVHPMPWRAHNQGRVDAEWRAYLVERSEEILERAAARLSPDLASRLVVHANVSSGRGLAEVAETEQTAMVVIGSAPGGSSGRVIEGSTSDQLLHGAALPVLVVPSGYVTPASLPGRVTVEYLHTLDSTEALRGGVGLARRSGAPLRLVTLVVHPPARLRHAADLRDELRRDARRWLDEAAGRLPAGLPVQKEIAEGPDFAHAAAGVDVESDELLVCGSSTAGPVARVLLGDATSKILRSSPVPVLVVPRGSDAADLDLTQSIPRIEV